MSSRLDARVVEEPSRTRLCRMRANLMDWRATPRRRKVGRSECILGGPLLGGRLAERRFCRFARVRSSVACRKGFGQEVIKHFGARLGSMAHAGGDLRTDRTSIGLAGTEPLEVVDCGGRRRDGVGRANSARRPIVLRSAGQQDQHDPKPECYSQKEKHESRIPCSAHYSSGMQASR